MKTAASRTERERETERKNGNDDSDDGDDDDGDDDSKRHERAFRSLTCHSNNNLRRSAERCQPQDAVQALSPMQLVIQS